MPVKPFAATPGPLKWCDNIRSDIAMRALIEVGDSLRICCESRLDKKLSNWGRVLYVNHISCK